MSEMTKRKKHQWTEEDDLLLQAHSDKAAEEIAKIIGCSVSAIFYNKRRLALISSTEAKVKAQELIKQRQGQLIQMVEAKELPKTTGTIPMFNEAPETAQTDTTPGILTVKQWDMIHVALNQAESNLEYAKKNIDDLERFMSGIAKQIKAIRKVIDE